MLYHWHLNSPNIRFAHPCLDNSDNQMYMFQIHYFHRQRPRRQAVFICCRSTVQERSRKMRIIANMYRKTAFAGIDTSLIRYAGIVAVHTAFSPESRAACRSRDIRCGIILT